MNYNIYDDYVEFNSNDSSGLVKINVAMDKSAFSNNISYINQDTLDKITSEDDYTFEILITLFIVSVLLILSIYKVIYMSKRSKLAKDKDYIRKIVNKLKTNDITPFEFSRMMHIERVSVNEFKLVFLDLLRKDILRIQENNIYFDYSINNSLKSFEINLINALLKYAKQDNNNNYISMDDLLLILKNSDLLYDIFANFNDNKIKQFKRENKKEFDVLKYHYKNYSIEYTTDMMQVIKKYITQNFNILLFAFLSLA